MNFPVGKLSSFRNEPRGYFHISASGDVWGFWYGAPRARELSAHARSSGQYQELTGRRGGKKNGLVRDKDCQEI
jgi:hypothetical protein